MGLRARNGLLLTGIAMAAAVPAVAAITLAGSTRPTATEADEVRAVLRTMNNSYNRVDFTDFSSHVCADMLRASNYQAGWYTSRRVDGTVQITVNSVNVTGNAAVANVRFVAANHRDAKTLDVDFRREGNEWKACLYHVTRVT